MAIPHSVRGNRPHDLHVRTCFLRQALRDRGPFEVWYTTQVREERSPVEYREFLRTTLPALGLRWRRFRSGTIRRRLGGRLHELGFSSLTAYRSHLLAHP